MKHQLDFEKPIIELQNKLTALREHPEQHSVGISFEEEILLIEKKIEETRRQIFLHLTPWQRVQLARHPKRPYTLDYFSRAFTDFQELHGDRLFAGVDSYHTKARDIAKLETHRKYVDIQVLISGSETFEIFPKQGLTVSESYIPERDVEFYQVPAETRAKITMNPGQFIVFFPEDAHMPCLMTGNSPQPVKKVVIKVAVDLLK